MHSSGFRRRMRDWREIELRRSYVESENNGIPRRHHKLGPCWPSSSLELQSVSKTNNMNLLIQIQTSVFYRSMVVRDGRPKKARIRSNSAITHIMRSKS
jgi:hypothetical protein